MDDIELFNSAKECIEQGQTFEASQYLLSLIEQYPDSKYFSTAKRLISSIDAVQRGSSWSWSDSLVSFTLAILSILFSLASNNWTLWSLLSIPALLYGIRALSKQFRSKVQLGGYSVVIAGLCLSISHIVLIIFELIVNSPILAATLSCVLVLNLIIDIKSTLGTRNENYSFNYNWLYLLLGYSIVFFGIMGLGLAYRDSGFLMLPSIAIILAGSLTIFRSRRVVLTIEQNGFSYRPKLHSAAINVKHKDISLIEFYSKTIYLQSHNNQQLTLHLRHIKKSDRHSVLYHFSILKSSL